MTKLTEILNNILNEELVGEIDSKYEVYKNPKSIKRMESRLRAISDAKGNLYIVNDSHNIMHLKFSIWLTSHGISMPRNVWHSKKHMAWNREANTNRFYLSDSYTRTQIFQNKNLYEKLIKKVKSKNSQYDFVLKSIEDLK